MAKLSFLSQPCLQLLIFLGAFILIFTIFITDNSDKTSITQENFKNITKLTTSNTEKNKTPTSYWVRDKYEYGFVYPNEDVCPFRGRDTYITIIVQSHPKSLQLRNVIRETWGRWCQTPKVILVFMLGKTSNYNATLQESLSQEMQKFQDLIIVNVQDSYQNLSLKSVSMLEWMTTYCDLSRYLLKTDVDSFVNIPELVTYLWTASSCLLGIIITGGPRITDKDHKWYVPDEVFSGSIYPNFLLGWGYVIPQKYYKRLYTSCLSGRFIHLEDVFVTGFSAQREKICQQDTGPKRLIRNNEMKQQWKCVPEHALIIHHVEPKIHYRLYNFYTTKKYCR